MANDHAAARNVSSLRMAFVASIGGFLFGFDLGMIGAANIYLREQFNLNESEFGFATASAVLGCIFGPILGAWLCDAISRRRTMMLASALLLISAIFTCYPDAFSDGSRDATLWSFNLFRIVGGLGVGLCSVASPMYIAEISPPHKRGAMGLMYQLAIVVGHAVAPLAAFFVVYFLRVRYGVTADMVAENIWLQPWRWMFLSEALFIALFVGFLAGLPYSPRWLAAKGRWDEAKGVLTALDGAEFAERELQEIRTSLQEESGAWSDLWKPGMRYALLIGVLLTFFNNWTGWSVIGGYIPRLLESAGFNRESAIGNFVAVYGAMGLMTVASLVLMDRMGRRPLWQIASLMMAAITFFAGLLMHREATGWPVLLLLGLVTIPHGLALGGIPWLMMSELFPTRLRAKAVAVATTVLWVFIYVGVYLFPVIRGYSQRSFLSARNVAVTGSTISFVDSNPDAIVDAEGRFGEAGFRPNDEIAVLNAASKDNRRTFTVAQVEKDRLVLGKFDELAQEEPGANVTVQVGSAAGAFWLFTGVCMLSFLFGVFMMPETKGRTLEEIGASWQKRRTE